MEVPTPPHTGLYSRRNFVHVLEIDAGASNHQFVLTINRRRDVDLISKWRLVVFEFYFAGVTQPIMHVQMLQVQLPSDRISYNDPISKSLGQIIPLAVHRVFSAVKNILVFCIWAVCRIRHSP